MRSRLGRLLGWLHPGLSPRAVPSAGSRRCQLESLEQRMALSTLAPTACACPYCSGTASGAAYVLAGGNAIGGGDVKWPQPGGPGSAVTITYSYSNLLDGRLGGNLSASSLRAVVQEAFSRWATVAPLHFVEVADSGPPPSDSDYSAAGRPMIRLGHRAIDGDAGVLAYGYYPGETGLGGDVQFDRGEFWTNNPLTGTDLLEVATHEIGHTLGLGHEPAPANGGQQAMMNPIYGGHFSGPGSSFLFQDDINGIRALYGSGTGSVRPLNGNAIVPSSAFVVSGNALYVNGTSGNDVFRLTISGSVASLTLNNESYALNTTLIRNIIVNLGAGWDNAQLTGGVGRDTLTATVGGTTLVGSTYALSMIGAEGVSAFGTSDDVALLYGSAGDDTFTATPSAASLGGAGYGHATTGFGAVSAYAGAGNDVAYLHGSNGNDGFTGTPTSALLYGSGYGRAAYGFDAVSVTAYSGTDYAFLHDSAGNDVFTGWPTMASLTGPGYALAINGFDAAQGYASSGTDYANLYGSSGNDVFNGGPFSSWLSGPGYTWQVHGFDQVNSLASTGTDQATLNGSSGNDMFSAWPTVASLSGTGYLLVASGFEGVVANGGLGSDTAFLYDSSGNDVFTGMQTSASFQGAGFANVANGFDLVAGWASQGQDSAALYDGSGDDVFTGWQAAGRLDSSTGTTVISGFDLARIYSMFGGRNRRTASALAYTLDVIGVWE